MAGRKNLNDLLNADRDMARQAQGFGPKATHIVDKNGSVFKMESTTNVQPSFDKTTGTTSSKIGWGGGSGVLDDLLGKGFSKQPSGQKWAPSCYETHPPLVLDGISIFGGSCLSPMVHDADIYVGFQSGMFIPDGARPWNDGTTIAVDFAIPDMGTPKDVTNFKKLVTWTEQQLRAGQKIHCGCIGGHGRTGMFLAALCKEMTGNEDAITYVRQNYCKKAVESAEQVKFLNAHFGIKIVDSTKGSYASSLGKYSTYSKGAPKDHLDAFYPMEGVSIFGDNLTLSKDASPLDF